MRILVDLQGAQTSSRFRGIGRYSLNFIKSLLLNRGQHEISILLSGALSDSIQDIRDELFGLIQPEKIHVWEGLSRTNALSKQNSWRSQASQLIRESFIMKLNPDVVILTSFFEGYHDDAALSIHSLDNNIPVVTIVHDLIPYLYQQDYLVNKLNKSENRNT
jgi:glycosyltransferase involved in cell wall biosynthesis